MQKINQHEFYTLGKHLRALAAYKNRDDIAGGEIFWDVIFASNAMNSLIEGRPFPLGISKKSAQAVGNAISELMKEFFTEENERGEKNIRFPKDGDQLIPSWKVHHICTYLETFETVFSEEMKETATYFVPKRGIFDTAALVEAAHETFPSEVRIFIPQKTMEEWKSAGRCLAFGMHSASGFHVARAVEGTLELYYQTYAGESDKTLKTWGDYLKKLSEFKQEGRIPSPSDKTISELGQMKDDYRNPIMHPRVILSESDARMLFANGESLIIAMAQEIKKDNKKMGAHASMLSVVPTK